MNVSALRAQARPCPVCNRHEGGQRIHVRKIGWPHKACMDALARGEPPPRGPKDMLTVARQKAPEAPKTAEVGERPKDVRKATRTHVGRSGRQVVVRGEGDG